MLTQDALRLGADEVVRADEMHCNGRIGVVGGSSGGSHAVFVALDKTPSATNTYPNWCQNGHDDRPDCAVSCSGAYDLSDREGQNENYVQSVENYTNTCMRLDSNGGYDQKSVSPVAKLKREDQQTFKPIFIMTSQFDSMPPHQMEDMRCALVAAEIPATKYKTLLIPDTSLHSFGYWRHSDGQNPPSRVRDDVIAFLDQYLKD